MEQEGRDLSMVVFLIVTCLCVVFFCCLFSFLALQSGEVSGCSNEFRSLMSVPTPGALQLKKHLTQGSQSGTQPQNISVPLTKNY